MRRQQVTKVRRNRKCSWSSACNKKPENISVLHAVSFNCRFVQRERMRVCNIVTDGEHVSSREQIFHCIGRRVQTVPANNRPHFARAPVPPTFHMHCVFVTNVFCSDRISWIYYTRQLLHAVSAFLLHIVRCSIIEKHKYRVSYR